MKKLIVMDLVWICGLDLISGTLDEKREYMGYDRGCSKVHVLKAQGTQKARCMFWLVCTGCHECRYAIKPVVYSVLLESNYS